jgi:hypothetical protein
MKTSNYITITFFVFLFGSIFLLYVSMKFEIGKTSGFEITSEEFRLDDFSVVVAENKSSFELKAGKQSGLKLIFFTEDSIQGHPTYKVKNDTLYMDAKTSTAVGINVTCKKIESLILSKNAHARLINLPFDTLKVNLNNARVNASSDKVNEQISFLDIQSANNCQATFRNYHIGNLNVSLNQSTVMLQGSKVEKLTGTLRNKSDLRAYRSIGKINLDVDVSSKYYLNK